MIALVLNVDRKAHELNVIEREKKKIWRGLNTRDSEKKYLWRDIT